MGAGALIENSRTDSQERKQWVTLVAKALKGASFEEALVSHTSDGIPIEPLSRRATDTQPCLRANPEQPWIACQRIDAPKVDRSALETHANGSRGIVEIVASAGDPAAAMSALRTAAGAEQDQAKAGELRLPNALLTVLDPAAFEARFGFAPGGGAEFRFAAVVFALTNRPAAEKLLADNGVKHHLRGSDIVVPPAPGQGAAFIFREQA